MIKLTLPAALFSQANQPGMEDAVISGIRVVEVGHVSPSRSVTVTLLVALPGAFPSPQPLATTDLAAPVFPLCGGCVGGWILVLMKARERAAAKHGMCRCCWGVRSSARTWNCPSYFGFNCSHCGPSGTEVSRVLGTPTRCHGDQSVILNLICITSRARSFFKHRSLKCQAKISTQFQRISK